MKKILAVAAVLASFVCFEAAAKKGPEITVTTINHQNKALGKDIPDWVEHVDNKRQLAKALDIDLKDTKVWIIQDTNTELNFVKDWANLVDARAEISRSIADQLKNYLSAKATGSSSAEEKATYNAAISRSTEAANNVTLNGLEKEAEYWIATREYKPGVKPKKAKTGDYTDKYTYYIVFTMDSQRFEDQLNAAMKDLEGNTEEMPIIRQALTDSVLNEITAE